MLTTLLGGRVFAERYGAEPPKVVALHGWGRNRSDWNAVLDGFDALALDQPGFGAAQPPDDAWDTAAYADWVADVLATLDRPVLVGHSFGGRVAIHLTATRPELVSGLVLTGVPLYKIASTTRPKLSYRLGRWAHARGLIPESRMDALRRKYGSADYRAAQGVMRDVLVKAVNEDYTPQVEQTAANAVPARLVWGEHDTAAPVWMAERAGETLNVAPTVVPGSAHLLDAGLNAALRAAIEELDTKERA